MAVRRGRRGRIAGDEVPQREIGYRNLKNPFIPQTVFSEDEVQALHDNALRVLQELGLKVLLPEARSVYKAAGALVDEANEMVRIGPEIIEQALQTAPSEFTVKGGSRADDVWFGPKAMVFLPGAGCPNANDRLRGRRPGSLRDFTELCQLVAGLDVMHMQNAVVEPQDVPAAIRHYATMRSSFRHPNSCKGDTWFRPVGPPHQLAVAFGGWQCVQCE